MTSSNVQAAARNGALTSWLKKSKWVDRQADASLQSFYLSLQRPLLALASMHPTASSHLSHGRPEEVLLIVACKLFVRQAPPSRHVNLLTGELKSARRHLFHSSLFLLVKLLRSCAPTTTSLAHRSH